MFKSLLNIAARALSWLIWSETAFGIFVVLICLGLVAFLLSTIGQLG